MLKITFLKRLQLLSCLDDDEKARDNAINATKNKLHCVSQTTIQTGTAVGVSS